MRISKDWTLSPDLFRPYSNKPTCGVPNWKGTWLMALF
jgi:hypothetical protein